MIFVDGLKNWSISLWMYLFTSSTSKAKELVDLVMDHGDTGSKCLAGAFHGMLPPKDLEDAEMDVYQAMLTYFRFSPLCSSAIIQAYEVMIENHTKRWCSFIEAVVDCEQFQLIDQDWVKPGETEFWEEVIEKIYQLKDGSQNTQMAKYTKHMEPNPKFLMRLIQRKVDETYIGLIWDRICLESQSGTSDDHGCSVQLDTFRCFALGLETSFDSAKMVLGMLERLDQFSDAFSEEERIFYTPVNWEFPEKLLDHLLDQLPEGCELYQKEDAPLLYSKKYSNAFWKKLFKRCKQIESYMQEPLEGFRPDLLAGLSHQN